MVDRPTVSVLVPNYNHERYLAARIDSIINQTYTDFELILMDDCSTDASRAILAQYTIDPRVQLAFNEKNSGSTFQQWKKGIALARGKYLWIAESDDYADSFFLETLVPILEKDDAIGLAYSNSIIVDDESHVTGNMIDWKREFFNSDRWERSFINDGVAEIESYLGSTCTINNASAVLFRKEALLSIGDVDTSFRYAGDWLTYLKVAMKYQIAYSSAPLNFYRNHSQNVSKQAEENSALLLERVLCLGFIYERADSATHQQQRLEQAANEYATIIYRCTRTYWEPMLLAKYMKRLFLWSPLFAVRLHAQLALRMIKGSN
ncbi:glycosyltransferase [Hymenobacter sp. ISL-91]|uniref:glycosyltransferase family 2 protein n=1 Tax=Hymenobacter sp. ISL-91 TaxID=2819151 RepID=UPI001BEABBDD|nr:glycosyltransferase [Hymenobacter sp. ISL-91]MBT2558538.1 glycosyltransferase [Hymenobacter sp. ISL-91]